MTREELARERAALLELVRRMRERATRELALALAAVGFSRGDGQDLLLAVTYLHALEKLSDPEFANALGEHLEDEDDERPTVR